MNAAETLSLLKEAQLNHLLFDKAHREGFLTVTEPLNDIDRRAELVTLPAFYIERELGTTSASFHEYDLIRYITPRTIRYELMPFFDKLRDRQITVLLKLHDDVLPFDLWRILRLKISPRVVTYSRIERIFFCDSYRDKLFYTKPK